MSKIDAVYSVTLYKYISDFFFVTQKGHVMSLIVYFRETDAKSTFRKAKKKKKKKGKRSQRPLLYTQRSDRSNSTAANPSTPIEAVTERLKLKAFVIDLSDRAHLLGVVHTADFRAENTQNMLEIRAFSALKNPHEISDMSINSTRFLRRIHEDSMQISCGFRMEYIV